MHIVRHLRASNYLMLNFLTLFIANFLINLSLTKGLILEGKLVKGAYYTLYVILI